MDISDFDIYCINLDERQDRWQESQREFSQLPFPKVQRVPAIKHSTPAFGCGLSHFQTLQRSLGRDKHVMIFEDDVRFINNFKELPEYLDGLDSLYFWDMLYLGANITTPLRKVSDRFARVYHAQSTHAYCVHKDFIATILKYKHLVGKPMDLIYAEDIIPDNCCFITIPMLAIQRPSFSNIEQRVVDYSWMENRYFEHLGKD